MESMPNWENEMHPMLGVVHRAYDMRGLGSTVVLLDCERGFGGYFPSTQYWPTLSNRASWEKAAASKGNTLEAYKVFDRAALTGPTQYVTPTPAQQQQHKCNCDLNTIMWYGCKCGGS